MITVVPDPHVFKAVQQWQTSAPLCATAVAKLAKLSRIDDGLTSHQGEPT